MHVGTLHVCTFARWNVPTFNVPTFNVKRHFYEIIPPSPKQFINNPRQLGLTAHNSVYTNIMFTWDSQKATINFEKHKVSFGEAATVFHDPRAFNWEDLEHSGEELRFKRLGLSSADRVLIVVYTIRRSHNANKAIRIISARQASRKERKAYAGQRH